jgi:hypothetical protein
MKYKDKKTGGNFYIHLYIALMPKPFLVTRQYEYCNHINIKYGPGSFYNLIICANT